MSPFKFPGTQVKCLRQSKNTPAIAKVGGNEVAGSIVWERSRHDNVRMTVVVKVANLITRWEIID